MMWAEPSPMFTTVGFGGANASDGIGFLDSTVAIRHEATRGKGFAPLFHVSATALYTDEDESLELPL